MDRVVDVGQSIVSAVVRPADRRHLIAYSDGNSASDVVQWGDMGEHMVMSSGVSYRQAIPTTPRDGATDRREHRREGRLVPRYTYEVNGVRVVTVAN